MWMNHRFSRVVNPAGQQYEDHENYADRFPFAYGASGDHMSGWQDAILKRPETGPLVLHTQSATEYWRKPIRPAQPIQHHQLTFFSIIFKLERGIDKKMSGSPYVT